MADLGRIVPLPKGNYDNATTYEKLDIVYYNGASYIAKASTKGNVPTNETFWQKIVEGVVVDSELSSTSTNPVQNKVIKEAIDNATPSDYEEVKAEVESLSETKANAEELGYLPTILCTKDNLGQGGINSTNPKIRSANNRRVASDLIYVESGKKYRIKTDNSNVDYWIEAWESDTSSATKINSGWITDSDEYIFTATNVTCMRVGLAKKDHDSTIVPSEVKEIFVTNDVPSNTTLSEEIATLSTDYSFNLDIATSFPAHTVNNPYYVVKGKFAYISGRISMSEELGTNFVKWANIPIGARPSVAIKFLVHSLWNKVVSVTIYTNGDIYLSPIMAISSSSDEIYLNIIYPL